MMIEPSMVYLGFIALAVFSIIVCHNYFWANYNDLTVLLNPGIMINKRNHPNSWPQVSPRSFGWIGTDPLPWSWINMDQPETTDCRSFFPLVTWLFGTWAMYSWYLAIEHGGFPSLLLDWLGIGLSKYCKYYPLEIKQDTSAKHRELFGNGTPHVFVGDFSSWHGAFGDVPVPSWRVNQLGPGLGIDAIAKSVPCAAIDSFPVSLVKHYRMIGRIGVLTSCFCSGCSRLYSSCCHSSGSLLWF